MINVSPYPGDEKARELTGRFFSHTTFEELRASLMGNILGLKLISPIKVLERIQEEDGPQEKGFEEVQEFLGVFMGLWNQLASQYQDENNPFSLTAIPNDMCARDPETWKTLVWRRFHELDEFLISLQETDTYCVKEAMNNFNPSFLHFLFFWVYCC